MNAARRRQIAQEVRKRHQIAREAAQRAAGLTPYLDGACPNCGEGEAHVAFTTSLGRIVCMRATKPPWWRRLIGRIASV